MEFLDEKILEFRRRARNEEHMDLESGMYIDGELMEFERVKLFDGKMDIMLPSSFIDLPSNLARIKYPSEQRPHIIKTSLDTSVNMTFSLYGMKIRCDQTKKAAEEFRMVIKKVNPAYVFYDLEEEELGNSSVSWFDFKGFCVDDPIYYMMYVTPVGGYLMHGIFNCPYRKLAEWRDAAGRMMRSIHDCTGEETRI